MYKNEYILGLIGSVLAAVVTLFTLLGCLIGAFFLNTPYLANILSQIHIRLPYNIDLPYLVSSFSGLIIIVAVICLLFAAASLILGFIGTAKLNKDDKSGGILLIVAGVLSLITCCGFIPAVLFLIGGIMALSKRQPVNQ